jgi:hypothetical protein
LDDEGGDSDGASDILGELVDVSGLTQFGLVNSGASRCHLIATLSAVLPLRVVRDIIANDEAPSLATFAFQQLLEPRAQAVFTGELESALASAAPELWQVVVPAGLQSDEPELVAWCDVWHDAADTFERLVQTLLVTTPALANLFRFRARMVKEASEACGRRDEVVDLRGDRFVIRVYGTDFNVPGNHRINVLRETIRCATCGEEHEVIARFESDRFPIILTIEALSHHPDFIWLPRTATLFEGQDERVPVEYQLVSFVQLETGDNHYTAFVEDRDRRWVWYNDQGVRCGMNVKVEQNFVRGRFRLAFYMRVETPAEEPGE